MIPQPSIVLFSKSPRRAELLKLMGIPFELDSLDVDESFPESLTSTKVAQYIAEKKAMAYTKILGDKILITADTVVDLEGEILGKPLHAEEATSMLRALSAKSHYVHTGVCLKHQGQAIGFTESTKVTFKHLSDEEIAHYVNQYQPYDKAGAYGIQEWIGLVAVKSIEGSYTNVMGLPTEKLYQHLQHLSQ